MAREEREDSYSGFEDALDEMTPVMKPTLTKVMEEMEEKELMTRVRSKSELDELKDEFDREDVEHKGEISGESVGRMLRKSKSRVVKRVLSGGKFGVSDIQTLAKVRDVNNSNTSSFKELVEVLHAADNITDEEGSKSEGTQLIDNNDNDEWEKAEKRYTKSAIERHHRRSSAGRSIKVVAAVEQQQQQQQKKIEQAVEKNDMKQEKVVSMNEDEAVDRIIRGVPHPKQNNADCACACVLM